MAITLSQTPMSANAKLEPADLAQLIGAIEPLVTLPSPENWTNIAGLMLNIQPDGSAVLNVRFKA
jgi:hypothetical protein